MFDYIINNKEQIFSGIGVSVVGVIFLVLKNFWHKNQKSEIIPSTTAGPHAPAIASDIPQEDIYRIMKEVEEMPPLHLEDVRNNYVGLNVDWLTEYNSAYKRNDDLINVSLIAKTKSFRPIFVHCEVRLSGYKQFSILKKEAKVRIIGTISKFDSYSFELSNVQLYFQKQRYKHSHVLHLSRSKTAATLQVNIAFIPRKRLLLLPLPRRNPEYLDRYVLSLHLHRIDLLLIHAIECAFLDEVPDLCLSELSNQDVGARKSAPSPQYPA